MTDDRALEMGDTEKRERLLPEYRDDLMGVPLLLLDSAREIQQDGETAVTVPDPEGLEAAVAVARITMPPKLNGQEIRFLRRAIGQKANSLADFLDVAPETFSRWENGKDPISQNPERILRLRVFHCLKDKAPGIAAKANDILDLKIVPFRDPSFRLVFERLNFVVDGRREIVWSLRTAEEDSKPLRQRA